MQEVFKKLTCDKCGETVYLEQIGHKNGQMPIFEKPSSGWTVIDGRDVCINCSAKYNGMIRNFWNE